MFDKKITNIVKLIAILFMLAHHLFVNNPYYQTANINYFPMGQNLVFMISTMGRICINYFVFISGYGMYKSYKNQKFVTLIDSVKFIISRIIGLLMQFWLYYALVYIITSIITGNVFLYGTSFISLKYFVFDILGISFLFKTPLLNDTWWYLSFALLFISIFPILVKYSKKYSLILLMISLALLRIEFISAYLKDYYLMFFYTGITGIVFARYEIFDKMMSVKLHTVIKALLATVFMVLIFMGRSFGLFERTINTYLVILTIFLCITIFKHDSWLKLTLSRLGENSTGIYYIHYVFCTTSLYFIIIYPQNFIIIILFLFTICALLSKIVSKIEKRIKYDLLRVKIIEKIKLL